MGGLIIIFATVIPVLLFTRITNIYCFAVGFYGLDGRNRFYRRLFKKNKKNKDGLSGIFKIIGQLVFRFNRRCYHVFSSRYYHQRKYADAQVVNRNNAAQNFAPAKKRNYFYRSVYEKITSSIIVKFFWMDENNKTNGLGWFLFLWLFLS